FFSGRRRHTRSKRDWSSDVCSSDLAKKSSGEPDVVLWASNDFESTCATLDYLIVKSGKKLSSYFKAVATNFPVVNDLPAEGEIRSEEHTSELQSRFDLVCRLLLETK